MVHINKNLGNMNLSGLAKSKGTEVKKEDFKPETTIQELKIYQQDKDGKLHVIYDDGKRDTVILLGPDGKLLAHDKV